MIEAVIAAKSIISMVLVIVIAIKGIMRRIKTES
jgi:hypothetical protein